MGSANPLPTGTVTFLLTDIEGSTRLWELHPEAMRPAVTRHDDVVAAAIEQHGGIVIRDRCEGDSFFAVFARASDAVAAARDLQRALAAEPWPAPAPIRTRAALHTGDVELRAGAYFGPCINRCARLRAIGHGGQILLSQATARLMQDDLPAGASLRDLGLHRLKDLECPEQVYQLLHPDLNAAFPPLSSLTLLQNNLPQQLTRFIGREREMEEVERLLRSTHLLTLTGAGGLGKTRLALQVAANVVGEYPDGVWLVELAPLAPAPDPSIVAQEVARALSVREQPGRSLLETLAESLQPRQLLLLLDNCEHLVAACAALAVALLRACPGLTLLATSREALNLAGETVWRLPSLSLPEPGAAAEAPPGLPRRSALPVETLLQSEAVRLFLDRSVRGQPRFAVTDANAPAVAQVCRRLDGIPLAIELAAARVRVLSVEQIAARLDDRFRLLTGGDRAGLPRQQTLRATIDWSHDLLTEPERALLRRLSVFAGGWTLEAAEAVCSDCGLGIADCGLESGSSFPNPQWSVLDLLGQLVDKSLVIAEDQGEEVRYRLLETIRQYGQEHLRGAAEEAVLRARHRDWFLELAQRAQPELQGPRQGEWLARLEVEHDNLRAALSWSAEVGASSGGGEGPGETGAETEAGLRLGAALWRFWEARGYLTEGRERLAALLAPPALPGSGGPAPTVVRARAQEVAGVLAMRQGDYEAARALYEASPRIYRELDDKEGVVSALNNLGNVAHAQGELDAARQLHEECLAVRQELKDQRGISYSLNNLGNLAFEQEEYEAARTLYEKSLAIKRELGDRLQVAFTLSNLGNVALLTGNCAAARALYEESLTIARELGDPRAIANVLHNLGFVARSEGEYGAARALHQESLAMRRDLGDKRGIAECLVALAEVACAPGQAAQGPAPDPAGRPVDRPRWAAAARFFGAAEALREAMGAPPSSQERAEVEPCLATLRAALGETALAAAWAEGRTLTLERAIAQALQEDAGERISHAPEC